MRFIDLIPQPHQNWWRAWGLDFDLFETRATCSACNMVRAGGAIRDGETLVQTYDVGLKCCTFFPEIPNFVWSSLSQNFQKPVEGTLSPRGLSPAFSYRERFAATEFGRSRDLLCPFFSASSGGCSIWQTRPSPCVRFICQSSYGMAGQRVWEAAEALIGLTEKTLSHDILLRLGLTSNEIASGEWYEFKPDDVYKRAGEIVASLSENEVWQMLQPEATSLRDQLCQAAASAIRSGANVSR